MVLLVDQAEAREGQPGVAGRDGRAVVDDGLGVRPGGDDGDVVGIGAEGLDDAGDEPVDEAGEAVDDAGLQRLDGVLADDVAGQGELDAAQLGAATGQRLERELDAGRDGSADVAVASSTTSKIVAVPLRSTTIAGPP